MNEWEQADSLFPNAQYYYLPAYQEINIRRYDKRFERHPDR